MKFDTYKNQRQTTLSSYKGTLAYRRVQTLFGEATILIGSLLVIALFI